MIRLGIVGIGGYGRTLIRAINEVGPQADCRLVAAADLRMAQFADQAEQLSRQGVELFGDAAKMFEAMEGKCDAMYIATSINSHAPLTLAALGRGYHVHLEKPPAATIQEVDEMLQALQSTDRFCIVGFHGVHATDIRLLKQRIVEGRLGRITSISCYCGAPRARAYYTRNEWAGTLQSGGKWVLDGPATNATSHQINNMLLLASPRAGTFATPAAVRAELYAAGPIESHDTAAIEIQTAEGPILYLLTSHCTDEQLNTTMDIQAEHAHATWTVGDGCTISYTDGSSESCRSPERNSREQIVIDFVEAIRTGDASFLRCDLAQARAAVLGIDGAHESSKRVHRIPGSHARRVAEGTDKARTIVNGLDEMLRQGAADRKLLSDLAPAAPWTVPTNTFDMSNYTSFPQQFSCH